MQAKTVSVTIMSLLALRRGAIIHNRCHFYSNNILRRTQYRAFCSLSKQEKADIPPHLIRKGKRRIPEPYIKILKQVPPRNKGIVHSEGHQFTEYSHLEY